MKKTRFMRRTSALATAIGLACLGSLAVATTPASAACGDKVTYHLNRAANPNADQRDAYNKITSVMDKAVAAYSCNGSVWKYIWVDYTPGVPTAEGSDGYIAFGKDRFYMNQATAQHEIAHAVGVGTNSHWGQHCSGGVWNGGNATNQLRSITGDRNAVLHCDRQHFWPYGLNYPSEAKSDSDYVNNVKIVTALRGDMGI